MEHKRIPNTWSHQFLHFFSLAALLTITYIIWTEIGQPFPFLFWLTISIPIIHQVFVWLAWRSQLNSRTNSKTLGFKTYLVLFFALLIGRVITFLLLAWSDFGSLGMNLVPRVIVSIACALPGFYTIYSVKYYFGFARAAGADHFDPKYRKMPLITKGIFKYSSNSMYVFGFLLFWAIALVFDSQSALVTSAFSHAYIWVHYYATERPDMNYLYRNKNGKILI